MNSIVQCPVCHQPLSLAGKKWACDNQHHFDLAKQGYCNLLLANQKKSVDPGDDRHMLEARFEFLNAGHYQPISEAINNIVGEHLSQTSQILDLGCGEGYYLSALEQSLENPDHQYYGTDISKQALKLAARHHKSIKWFVAAAKNQPFIDQGLDLILNIFAPADWQEMQPINRKFAELINSC